MIISRTPFRISFFGGGTDYPAWYKDHGGMVLGATIDKYCYLTCRYLPPFFKHRIRVVYSQIENCQTIDEITHPAAREVLRFLGMDRGVEVHHDGDLPARSGMGTSSSFTVGLLHGLYALKGYMPSKKQLALESIHIEQEMIKETVGSQDQVLVAFGGLNHIVFSPEGEISIRPVTVSSERLQELNSHLMLFYTGIERTASDIAESYVADVDGKKSQLRIMKHLVEESLSILNNGRDLSAFGALMHEGWQAKRSLSARVSNSRVDEIYAHAMSKGALGGKLLGAGGGGFMLLFVPPERQDRIREVLKQFIYVPIRFEFAGSQIIFFDPEREYSAEEKMRSLQEFSFSGELTEELFGERAATIEAEYLKER
jgi:D-glycero-alpha-D-manno-heptose-7-phosphate kinase